MIDSIIPFTHSIYTRTLTHTAGCLYGPVIRYSLPLAICT